MTTDSIKTLNTLFLYWRTILWIVYHLTIEKDLSTLSHHYFAATNILSKLIEESEGTSHADLQAQVQKDVDNIQVSYVNAVLLPNATDTSIVQSRDIQYRYYLLHLVASVFYNILADCFHAHKKAKLLSTSLRNKSKALDALRRMGGTDSINTQFALDEAVITRSFYNRSRIYQRKVSTDDSPTSKNPTKQGG